MQANPRGRPFRSGTPRLPRQQRRESLLLAATECFVENGYVATSMDAIADRGGVSKPVLYQHFDSKHELYMEILNSSVNKLYERVKTTLEEHPEPQDRVHAVVDAYYQFVEDKKSSTAVIYSSVATADPQIVGVIQNLHRSLADEFAKSIQELSTLGPAEAILMGYGLAGLLLTSGEQWMKQENTITREEAVAMISTLAWAGIQSTPPSQAEATVE